MQLQKELRAPEGYRVESRQQAALCWQKYLNVHSLDDKQEAERANYGWHKSLNSQSLPSVPYFLQHGHT